MKKIVFYGIIIFAVLTAKSQVGIGTTTPNALLDIKTSNQANPSNTDGILIPRVDDFPSIDPSANQDGMLVFVTGLGSVSKGLYYWNTFSSSWTAITSQLEKITEIGRTGWRLYGMDPTNYGNIGIGAIDLSHNGN